MRVDQESRVHTAIMDIWEDPLYGTQGEYIFGERILRTVVGRSYRCRARGAWETKFALVRFRFLPCPRCHAAYRVETAIPIKSWCFVLAPLSMPHFWYIFYGQSTPNLIAQQYQIPRPHAARSCYIDSPYVLGDTYQLSHFESSWPLR